MIMIKNDSPSREVTKVDLFSFFSGEKYLSKYLNTLAQNDIYTIGDLKKVGNESVFKIYPTSENNQKIITENLARIGVHIT